MALKLPRKNLRKGTTDMITNGSAAFLGKNMRTYRQRNDISLKELSKICGVSERQLCDIENFKCQIRSDTIDKICFSLGFFGYELLDVNF